MNNELDIRLGKKELVVQRRYEVCGAINDLIIAIWFLVGSFMFLNEKLVTDGTWLFVVGSAQMLIRPLITITKWVHLRKVRSGYHEIN